MTSLKKNITPPGIGLQPRLSASPPPMGPARPRQIVIGAHAGRAATRRLAWDPENLPAVQTLRFEVFHAAKSRGRQRRGACLDTQANTLGAKVCGIVPRGPSVRPGQHVLRLREALLHGSVLHRQSDLRVALAQHFPHRLGQRRFRAPAMLASIPIYSAICSSSAPSFSYRAPARRRSRRVLSISCSLSISG